MTQPLGDDWSLHRYRALFSELPAPALESLHGLFSARFVGPAWLRSIAPRGLGWVGLRGWVGKELRGAGEAFNVLERGGVHVKTLPMILAEASSLYDRKACVRLRYPPGTRLPWPYVVDELRRFDETTLLCLTVTNVAGLRGMPLPFVLERGAPR